MKKGLIIANIILIYLIPILLVLVFASSYMEEVFGEEASLVLLLIWPVYALILFVFNVIVSMKIWRGNEDTNKIIKNYFLIKVIQAPCYIFIFVLGVFFMITIFTMGVSLVFMLMDAISLVVSGVLGLAVFHRMKKAGMINGGTQLMMSVGSFIFCVDVIVSFSAYTISKKNAGESVLDWMF